MLDIRGVKKVYGGTRTVEAIRDLTVHLDEGELVCLVGPSGCGKTTLLKCVSGLLRPTTGDVVLAGQPVVEPPEGMAVVLQEYGRSLFPWMTVERNVELPLKERRVPKNRRRELVREALFAVGLDDTRTAYPWQLSGGMQQRVAIARAIACQPKILLMDEPFAAVDAQTRAELEDLLRRLWQRINITILFVTHDIDEAVYLGQRVVVLTARPTVVQDDILIDLSDQRDQIMTRGTERFTELRSHIYAEIRRAQTASAPDVSTAAEVDTVHPD